MLFYSHTADVFSLSATVSPPSTPRLWWMRPDSTPYFMSRSAGASVSECARRASSCTQQSHSEPASSSSGLQREKLSERGGKRTARIHVAPVHPHSSTLRRPWGVFSFLSPPFSLALETFFFLALGVVLVDAVILIFNHFKKNAYSSSSGSTAGGVLPTSGILQRSAPLPTKKRKKENGS